MQNNIRNTNLRFNLDKEQQRRAWEYLQTMDRQDFKSYSQVISLALVDYFDRYYRTRQDSGKVGTGLGLSITKAILQQHGFAFGVNSAVGQGSTFWFVMRDVRTGPQA